MGQLPLTATLASEVRTLAIDAIMHHNEGVVTMLKLSIELPETYVVSMRNGASLWT